MLEYCDPSHRVEEKNHRCKSFLAPCWPLRVFILKFKRQQCWGCQRVDFFTVMSRHSPQEVCLARYLNIIVREFKCPRGESLRDSKDATVEL